MTGPAADSKNTINQAFLDTVERRGDYPALKSKIDGTYQPTTYNQLADQVKNFALGLRELGLGFGDRVAMLAENSERWAVADLGILSLGAVNVPMFYTSTPAQVSYIVQDSGSKIICVSTKRQLEKVKSFFDQVIELEKVIIFDELDELDDPHTLTFNQVLEIGKKIENGQQIYQESSCLVEPDNIATIIYTSGTTGNPKGSILTHDNLMSNVKSGLSILEIDPDDQFLSFLPLSHVFERMAGYYIPIYRGACISYAQSPLTVRENMGEVCPTVMASVPRLYEMMHDRILKQVKSGSALRQKIFHWAVGVGRKVSELKQKGRNPGLILSQQAALADKLVFSKLKAVTGGRLRFFVSGGAPLPQSIAEFFHAAGILILEGYGLTETSPVISVNTLDSFKFGSVGKPIPGVEVVIAGDGEILTRGPHVMMGYHNKPEQTAEAIDEEGWFHTGDIGHFDEEGFLRITDRKKNILVLSNGKNVAPQPIENAIKQSSYINQIMLLGDNQKTVAALVVPDFDSVKSFAQEQGISTSDLSNLLTDKSIIQLIKQEISQYTSDFADFEQVRQLHLIDREFTAETDEMTPTLKLKRNVIMKNFADQISQMYS
ncbi:MAG: long-chain fatty acid--CoA ligase [Candidatus Poribacteria bacterium]|nr:long-chain fatty acid--CoA ligase [Candidatus Poribacteria bacterium]